MDCRPKEDEFKFKLFANLLTFQITYMVIVSLRHRIFVNTFFNTNADVFLSLFIRTAFLLNFLE